MQRAPIPIDVPSGAIVKPGTSLCYAAVGPNSGMLAGFAIAYGFLALNK